MDGKGTAADLTTIEGVKTWLRDALRDYRWNVVGILLDDGTTILLPKEPALTASIVESAVIKHLRRKGNSVRGLNVDGDETGRSYPDVLLSGTAVGHAKVAVDVKVARREQRKDGKAPTSTKSRITLGPYDSYFRWPDDIIPGPNIRYGDITWHLDLIVLYDYIDGEVKDVEVIVAETWRVASTTASSSTRNYIGAVQNIEKLRTEAGPFGSEQEFLDHWRSAEFKRPPRRVREIAQAGESLSGEPSPEG